MMKYWIAATLILLTGCQKSPEQNALRAANSLIKDNRLQAAMETVESCLKQHPDCRELLQLRVLILLNAEQLDSAFLALRPRVPSSSSGS